MPLELYFPLLNGGKVQGLNEAGIETFEGEYRMHIVRECGQNAADEKRDDQARVELRIRRHEISSGEIPGLHELRAAVESARRFWEQDAKTQEFCRKALKWTDGKCISVLEVADYGTTGLEGGDDDRRGSWFGLVRSEGVSNKRSDAGGAFGIGKDAPFAGSFIRTVLYSTLNQSGGHAFQGVTKLTTHLDSAGRKTQPDGFIGVIDRSALECRALRIRSEIPVTFRRSQIGTSLFIVAYRDLGGEDWTEEFARHAVENFWPAIHRGTLAFEIGGKKVDAENLPTLMSHFSGIPDFGSQYHYRAVVNENRIERTTVLPRLGACRLFLVAGDATYPKTVCMTRQTGMVIFEATRFKSYRPFAGLFVCESREGNEYLRQLEPPRHDKWDAKRVENDTEAKAVLKSIRDFVNESLRELNPDSHANEAEVPELSRYLPDDEDEPMADESVRMNEYGGTEGLVSGPVSQPLAVHEVSPRPAMSDAGATNTTPRDGNESGLGEGDGQPNPRAPRTDTPGGKGSTTGGGATGTESPHGVRVPLRTRSVQTGPKTYRLLLRSEHACVGRLGLVSVGDDNREDRELAVVRIVNLATNKEISPAEFSIMPGDPTLLEVSVESTVPVSLRAYCHGD